MPNLQKLPITTNTSEQYVPAIYSSTVVWQDDRNENGDIRGTYPHRARRPTPQKNNQMLPLSQNNISKTNDLQKQAEDLLSQAKSKNLDASTCEKLIDEANELLREAKLRKASSITANYYALQAIEKLRHAIDCLKALLG